MNFSHSSNLAAGVQVLMSNKESGQAYLSSFKVSAIANAIAPAIFPLANHSGVIPANLHFQKGITLLKAMYIRNQDGYLAARNHLWSSLACPLH